MATRSRTSFKKRQKEIARMEKQRDKAAKRMQRKLVKESPPNEANEDAQDEAAGDLQAPSDEPAGAME